jgi:hypothetical protein
MKKDNKRLFIILFSISLFFNLRQCSDSQSHQVDIDALEYDISELEKEISKEKAKQQKANKPKPKIKEVKKFRPRVKAPEPVDSIDSIPNIQVIDSLKNH